MVHFPSRALLRNTLPGSGSRVTVYQQRVAVVPRQTQFERQYEQTWELPRQCRRRELLPAFETGADQAADRPTRDDARQDVFDYIEMFYNPNRKHTSNGMLSPVEYEEGQYKLNKAGV